MSLLPYNNHSFYVETNLKIVVNNNATTMAVFLDGPLSKTKIGINKSIKTSLLNFMMILEAKCVQRTFYDIHRCTCTCTCCVKESQMSS